MLNAIQGAFLPSDLKLLWGHLQPPLYPGLNSRERGRVAAVGNPTAWAWGTQCLWSLPGGSCFLCQRHGRACNMGSVLL